MKQALLLLVITVVAFSISEATLGFWRTYEVGYGAITIMALMISGTFLWLWFARTTPLALGMAFSWAGCASVFGWRWLYRAFDEPESMIGHTALFLFLSLLFVGSVLHFATIQRSLGLHGRVFLWPVILAILIAYLVPAAL